MVKFLNPDCVAKPTSNYSQCVEVPAGARRLIISGQVGAKPDGTVVKGMAAQTEQVFDNIFAILRSQGMDIGDIVKITTFCTNRDEIAAMREVRTRRLAGHAPTSTLVFVSGLANPDYLIEIEAEAVKAG